MVAANEKKKGIFSAELGFNVVFPKLTARNKQNRKTIAKNAFQNLVLKTRHWNRQKAKRERKEFVSYHDSAMTTPYILI